MAIRMDDTITTNTTPHQVTLQMENGNEIVLMPVGQVEHQQVVQGIVNSLQTDEVGDPVYDFDGQVQIGTGRTATILQGAPHLPPEPETMRLVVKYGTTQERDLIFVNP